MGEVTRTWKTPDPVQLKLVTPRPVPSHTRIGFGVAFSRPAAGVDVVTGVWVGVGAGVGVGVGVGVDAGGMPHPLVVTLTVVEPSTAPFEALRRKKAIPLVTHLPVVAEPPEP